MKKHEAITLSLNFPEGQESPDTANVSKGLRAKIFSVLEQIDMGEPELPISMDIAGRISAVFAGTPFNLERVGDRLIVRKREIQHVAVADVQTADADADDRNEPDYYAHFQNGEWGAFTKAISDAIDLACKLRTPGKNGKAPRWKIWLDRGRRVFRYRGEETPLFVDGNLVDEKTLREWIKRINKSKRGIERRKMAW